MNERDLIKYILTFSEEYLKLNRFSLVGLIKSAFIGKLWKATAQCNPAAGVFKCRRRMETGSWFRQAGEFHCAPAHPSPAL